MTNMISNVQPWFPSQPSTATPSSGAADKQNGFGSSLVDAIDQVEQVHTDAQSQVKQLLHGDRQDVHNVMIAVEKADVSFQLMMQVRNKIVNAYQEVSKLQF
jgi:flagellar hook-basal body complex protein FliE